MQPSHDAQTCAGPDCSRPTVARGRYCSTRCKQRAYVARHPGSYQPVAVARGLASEVEELRAQVERLTERLLLAQQARAEAQERAETAEAELARLLPARERLAEMRPALEAAVVGYRETWRFLPPTARRRELTPLQVSAFHAVVAASTPGFHDGAEFLTVDDLLTLASDS